MSKDVKMKNIQHNWEGFLPMYKLCKTARSAARQREIERALLTLMAQHPYEQITVTELCEYMQMPRKAFYRYFDTKADALQALIEHTMLDFEKQAPVSPRVKRSLKEELGSFFSFWQKERRLLETLEQNGLISLLIQCALHMPLRDATLTGKFLPEEAEWARPHVFKFAICGLITMMLEWFHDGFQTEIERMAELATRLLSKPLFQNLDTVGFSE